MRVLITGGAGFIGSNVALKLTEQGFKVTILDNLNPQIHGIKVQDSFSYKSIIDKVSIVIGDVCNRNVLAKVIPNQDAIIHMASETGTGQSMYQISRYTMTNIQGTANFLDYLSNNKHSVKKVIIASSRAVYGEGMYRCLKHGTVYPSYRLENEMMKGDFEVKCPICFIPVDPQATDEKSPPNPSSVYAITKLSQEQLILTICQCLGISAIALRYQNVFGPGQSLLNPYTGILSIFSKAISKGEQINIFEDGQESRDFIYIDDVVQATTRALINSDLTNHTINIGTGVRTTVHDALNELNTAFKVRSRYTITGDFRLGDIRHNFADISKMKYHLGFTPKWSFSDGIKSFVKWAKNELL